MSAASRTSEMKDVTETIQEGDENEHMSSSENQSISQQSRSSVSPSRSGGSRSDYSGSDDEGVGMIERKPSYTKTGHPCEESAPYGAHYKELQQNKKVQPVFPFITVLILVFVTFVMCLGMSSALSIRDEQRKRHFALREFQYDLARGPFHMFGHYSWWHFLVNSLAWIIYGVYIETSYGSSQFGLLFIVSYVLSLGVLPLQYGLDVQSVGFSLMVLPLTLYVPYELLIYEWKIVYGSTGGSPILREQVYDPLEIGEAARKNGVKSVDLYAMGLHENGHVLLEDQEDRFEKLEEYRRLYRTAFETPKDKFIKQHPCYILRFIVLATLASFCPFLVIWLMVPKGDIEWYDIFGRGTTLGFTILFSVLGCFICFIVAAYTGGRSENAESLEGEDIPEESESEDSFEQFLERNREYTYKTADIGGQTWGEIKSPAMMRSRWKVSLFWRMGIGLFTIVAAIVIVAVYNKNLCNRKKGPGGGRAASAAQTAPKAEAKATPKSFAQTEQWQRQMESINQLLNESSDGNASLKHEMNAASAEIARKAVEGQLLRKKIYGEFLVDGNLRRVDGKVSL